MNSNKFFFVLVCLGLTILSTNAFTQSLLNSRSWTIGSGSVGEFAQNGSTSENTRIWSENPFGIQSIIWEAKPDVVSGPDGGWNSSYFNIDHTKMYRFTVWIKKTNSTSGTTYFGTNATPSTVTSLSGSSNSNPYFWTGDLPELNKWFLLVGYIHGSGDPSTKNYGGIYDGETGKKVLGITDYKFPTTTTHARHRAYLYYDTNTSNRQYFWSPRVDEMNGEEPTIEALLGLSTKPTNNGDQVFTGKLGVNTSNLGDYSLTVNGTIRTKEVKVETGWADYVFQPDYDLISLSEVADFIAVHGHLPDLPSAKEVKANGVGLAEMNTLLLQKIEELTLYLIEMKKENDSLKQSNKRIDILWEKMMQD